MTMHRRDLFKSGLAGLAGMTFARSSLASARAGSARIIPSLNGRRIILLPMRGGFDGLEMLPPVTQTYQNYLRRRPTLQIVDTSLALPDNTGLAFHPNMPRMKQRYDNNECALLHQVGWPGSSFSHFISQDRNASARPERINHDSGWMIRAAEHFGLTTTDATATGVGSVLDVRQTPGSSYRPLSIGNVESFKLPINVNDTADPDSIARNTAGKDAECGVMPNAGPETDWHVASKSAFGLVDAVGDGTQYYDGIANGGAALYSDSGFGKNLKELARLLSVSQTPPGTPMRYNIPQLGLTFGGGFDTHDNQAQRMGNLLTDVDNNLEAFILDLVAMGLYDSTAIVFYTEFGRRIDENGNFGTDHGEGNNAMVIGGNVNGGQHFGNITSAGVLGDINVKNVPSSMDFRHLFERLLIDWLGASVLDARQIIDQSSDPTMRPDLSNLFV